MKRQDIHRPSAIIPEDYSFVAFDFIKIENLGDCYVLNGERARKAEHMARTGGKYSQHEHGGNCYVCGSVNAIYTCTFYHEKTNTYIRTGQDCAEKLDMSCGDFNAFRAAVQDARAAQAGKKKAQVILEDESLGAAWAIYTAAILPNFDEERIVRDIVSKLVKYGNISDRASKYLGILLNKIENRAAVQAKREAEKAAAAPCPTGRIVISGLVLKTEVRDGYYGVALKMLVKHDTGWMVWGTAPRSLESSNIQRGDRVSFTATVEPSKNDSKFGFCKRPTGGVFLSRNAETVAAKVSVSRSESADRNNLATQVSEAF